MKILFIRSGNNGRDPISTRQGESLQKIGLEIDFYDIIGKGILGYLATIPQLRKYIHKDRPDIIHAHYSLCGIVAALARPKLPIVTSLMGSDLIQSTLIIQLIIRQLSRHIWTRTIVKSNDLFQRLKNDRAIILPNGVDSDLFFEMDKNQALEKLGWSRNIKHVLFGSSPTRVEKNFKLAERALAILKKRNVNFELHFLDNIQFDEVVYHYNAADILLLTSDHEGSPNVIKEAMACNCPIVATDVGDVKDMIENISNCFLVQQDASQIADKLEILCFSNQRTNGRTKISRFDSKKIAGRLKSLYQDIFKDSY